MQESKLKPNRWLSFTVSYKMIPDYGLNYVDYDLTIDSTAVKDYLNELNADVEEEIKLEKADNDFYYIQPGTYDVEITLNGVTEVQALVIKAPEKKERGKQKKTP
ncbi:MAG: hypothetical protein U5K00_23850 [Melioribacteraceae bacterium]|nr:hypothetical protein [Melioribacteraceae bacterium]